MYEIGQIVYALISEKKILLPVKIVEEITIKNLESETTTYKVLLPNKKNQKVNLDKFDNVFASTDEATEFLVLNAKSAIEELVMDTINAENSAFKVKTKAIVNSETCNNDKSSVKINIGDGIKANINIDNLKQYTSNIDRDIEEEIEESTSTWRIQLNV